jgi:hypothetical protein
MAGDFSAEPLAQKHKMERGSDFLYPEGRSQAGPTRPRLGREHGLVLVLNPLGCDTSLRDKDEHEVCPGNGLFDLWQPFLSRNEVLAIHPNFDALLSQVVRNSIYERRVRSCVT